MDWIVTGASRGIGRALAEALIARATPGDRVFVLARDLARLEALVHSAAAGKVVPVQVDLARVEDARRAGRALAEEVRGAVLIHNAGVWPTRRSLVDGVEVAFATNCVGPLALQGPLLAERRVDRVLVVSAGLLAMGRFDAERTPVGKDFSVFRTYCSTKLAGAVAMRDEARRHPEVDFAVVHPGVVNTDLGAMSGPIGWLMRLVKRRWETPETCAARLIRILDRPRWERTPGEAPWLFEDTEQDWPAQVDRASADVRTGIERTLPAGA